MKTKENQLLNLLNSLYGFDDAKSANYKKIKQYFDEQKSENVFYLEFRVKRKGEKPVTFDPDHKKKQRLLYHILRARKTS